MATKSSRDILLYTDTARSADALYFGDVQVTDPFISFSLRGKKYCAVNALEFGRVKRTSSFDEVLPLEAWQDKARKAFPGQRPAADKVIAVLAKELKAGTFTVPSDFPAGLFEQLKALKVKLAIADGDLFPEREVKSKADAEGLREGNRCSAAGIAAAEKLLRRSKIRSGKLFLDGTPLTSERLKVAIETACIEQGSVSTNTIAAGGDQGCDPHDRGSGPLRANELIVLDVFPRVTETGFFGDMTRTFLRGRASDAQKAIVSAVREAQLAALGVVRAGVTGKAVHQEVLDVFAKRGFETRHTPKGSVGFFHGTGHGVGLDIHEAPRLSPISELPLKKGTVVTVEPGLYYPGIGGCRIEDVVQVTSGPAKMLSSYHYEWELK
ncbi:MAG TPA: Xaa-Pro peptidase family protein [Opitutaceae bacterium]|jgi:Xaa-Pro aminopeptidase|nr:Xaa-Pro peptidase family protein [Opitutaceae bacterium]